MKTQRPLFEGHWRATIVVALKWERPLFSPAWWTKEYQTMKRNGTSVLQDGESLQLSFRGDEYMAKSRDVSLFFSSCLWAFTQLSKSLSTLVLSKLRRLSRGTRSHFEIPKKAHIAVSLSALHNPFGLAVAQPSQPSTRTSNGKRNRQTVWCLQLEALTESVEIFPFRLALGTRFTSTWERRRETPRPLGAWVKQLLAGARTNTKERFLHLCNLF